MCFGHSAVPLSFFNLAPRLLTIAGGETKNRSITQRGKECRSGFFPTATTKFDNDY